MNQNKKKTKIKGWMLKKNLGSDCLTVYASTEMGSLLKKLLGKMDEIVEVEVTYIK